MNVDAPDEPADHELLRRIGQGGLVGRNALETLFRRYRGRLLGVARSRGLSHEEAEDVVQDVFVKLVRAAPEFKGTDSAKGWLAAMTRNAAIDHFRRRSKEFLADDEGWDVLANTMPDPGDQPHEVLRKKLLQECIDAAYERFATKHPGSAEILFRAVSLGLTIVEVSAMIGRTPGATKEFLSQCRKKLKALAAPCADLATPE